MDNLKGTAYFENLKDASIVFVKNMNVMSINKIKAKYNDEVLKAYMQCNK